MLKQILILQLLYLSKKYLFQDHAKYHNPFHVYYLTKIQGIRHYMLLMFVRLDVKLDNK